MRDTLKHLVATTIEHKDANKVLYILNQIDTSAKEDNLEEVIGSWQRALANEGLISGNFYAIYNENAANVIEDKVLEARLKRKKDIDLAQIMERMDQVSVERAYRIVKSLETFAKEMKEEKIPLLKDALHLWWKKVLFADLAMLVLIGTALAVSQSQFDALSNVLSSPLQFMSIAGISSILLLITHIKARTIFANKEAKKWETKDIAISQAIEHNTRWWKHTVGIGGKSWHNKTKAKLEALETQGRALIQKLNDQYVSPNGQKQ